MYGVRSAVVVQHPSSTNHLILVKLVVIYLMRAETSFLSVKCGTEVTAALCLLLFLLLLLSVSGEPSLELLQVTAASSWQRRSHVPQGSRDSRTPRWMRSVCPVSFGSQCGLSSPIGPPAPAERGPLCVDPAPPWTRCSLAFSHATVSNHPAHPPLNPEPPSPSPTSA